jgi:peptidoglycan/xylan/chitin deacetylase (PgdA/CDA1 family)
MPQTSVSVGPWPAPPLVSASIGLHAAALGAVLLAPEAAWWALAGVGVNHLALGAVGLWPRSTLLGPNLSRLPSASGQSYALTLDDGPDPEVTPRVLDLLHAAGVRATFFCIAQRARTQPALIRRIVEQGHSVQNHSLGHRHHFALLGPQGLRREIGQAQDILTDLCGLRPHCFRAPAGLRNPFLDPVLHQLGLTLVSWTRRGYDTLSADPRRVVARLIRNLAPRDILLLHDGHTRRAASGHAVVLEVLPRLLECCRAAGLQALTLREAVPLRPLNP